MKKLTVSVLITLMTLTLHSCYKDNKEDLYGDNSGCDTSNITYTGNIAAVMTTSCAGAGCHNNASLAAGIDLSNYNSVKTIADNGKLMSVINHESGVPAMPQGAAKLDDCTIAQIQKWVNDGALNN